MRNMMSAALIAAGALLGWSGGAVAAARLAEIIPAGHKPVIHLSLTDDHPYAQAFVIIEAVAE